MPPAKRCPDPCTVLSDDVVRLVHERCLKVHNGVSITVVDTNLVVRFTIDDLAVRERVCAAVTGILLRDWPSGQWRSYNKNDARQWQGHFCLRNTTFDADAFLVHMRASVDVCNVARNAKTRMISFGVREPDSRLSGVCRQFRDALRVARGA
jgi:hypothetical protein